MNASTLSRRDFARLSATVCALAGGPVSFLRAAPRPGPLGEFSYGDVHITSAAHEAQLENTHDVLMSLSDDSLLKPFRQMAGAPAPGAELGGWYRYDPNFDWRTEDAGLAPGATFGQWISALARCCAITESSATRNRVLGLNQLYAQAISEAFFEKNRFPAYCYDKLVLGLVDSKQFVHDPAAMAILEHTTRLAVPHLPGKPIDREVEWRPGKDQSFRWDESYTLPENLFIAYQRGAGDRYRDMAIQYLDDATWFDPLARGENVLAGKHAYSYVNSLSSAMQAYLTLGSEKHLRASENAFAMLTEQSFATGGWGPEELLGAPDGGAAYVSLSTSHKSFETPCGAYAHFKLTRYLLRVTGDSRYGDSMERVMYNTVLGARPMHADGRAFYYSDYHFGGRKTDSIHGFPCCSGTLPQVAADYRINTYFRGPREIYVNLYVPSRLSWIEGGAQCSLEQSGDYPFNDSITMSVAVSGGSAADFALNLRIPVWAIGASIAVNGKPWRSEALPGAFATLSRRWRDGDLVDLQLPRTNRLEPIDSRHPDTVALLCGPLVLFALDAPEHPPLTRRQLLGVRQISRQNWATSADADAVNFLPFVAIDDEPYSTYLQVT